MHCHDRSCVKRRVPVFRMGHDPGVAFRGLSALTLWCLGYPAQALTRVHEALALTHALSHPFSLALARCYEAYVAQFRRDVSAVHVHAEAAVTLATTQGFPLSPCPGGLAPTARGESHKNIISRASWISTLLQR